MTTDPDTLSQFDVFQLDRLELKAQHEGSLDYAVENWPWLFEDADLAKAAEGEDAQALRAAIRATSPRRLAWWREHPHPTQIAPLEAHEAEVERREAAKVVDR